MLATLSRARGEAVEALKRWSPILAPGLVLLLAFSLRTTGVEVVEALEEKVFDVFQVLKPRPYQDVPVRVLDIDDASLERLGPWPWPRTRVAELIARLQALGAKTIALDIIFSEPDQLSPEQILKNLPPGAEFAALQSKLSQLPRHDDLLAEAVAKTPVVTGFVLVPQANQVQPALKAGFAYAGDSPLSSLGDLPGAIRTLPNIETAAAGNGNLSLVPERDGLVRKVPLLFRRGPTLYPSLVLETLRVYQGASGFVVRSSGSSGTWSLGQHTGISQVKVGNWSIPTDAQGRLRVYYAEPAPERIIPAWELFDPRLPKKSLAQAVVFVGSSSLRLRDLRATPSNPSLPGVDILAQAAEQILLQRFLHRPDWAPGAEFAFALFLGVGLILLLPRLGALWCGLLGLAVTLLVFPLSWYAFISFHWLLNPVFPSLVALLVYLSSSLVSFWRSESERRKLQLFDQLKDELIATVSHDLRGPVSGMIMGCEMLSRDRSNPLTEKQKQTLKVMESSGRKLINFVNNVLDAAKIKAGKMELHCGEVRAQEIVSGIWDLFVLNASVTQKNVVQNIPPDLPSLHADRGKLEQVINNLLGNALKFTPSGGRITLEAQEQGPLVRFCVQDTGPGIAPEDIPKLFKSFSQLELAGPKKIGIKGTGLGLSICRSIVEAHGGTIWVESQQGQGSSFYFTMPQFKSGSSGLPSSS